MKKIVVLVAAGLALLTASAAAAHPLGNFTINRFSRIEVSGSRVYVLYVLDMAEIPTFQAGKINAQAYAVRIAADAHLSVAGVPARLHPIATALAHPPGAGGLRTTRLEVSLLDALFHAAHRRDARYDPPGTDAVHGSQQMPTVCQAPAVIRGQRGVTWMPL